MEVSGREHRNRARLGVASGDVSANHHLKQVRSIFLPREHFLLDRDFRPVTILLCSDCFPLSHMHASEDKIDDITHMQGEFLQKKL